jgi:hypothetical protein
MGDMVVVCLSEHASANYILQNCVWGNPFLMGNTQWAFVNVVLDTVLQLTLETGRLSSPFEFHAM